MPATIPRDVRGRLRKSERTPTCPAGRHLDDAKLAFALSLLLLPFGWGVHWTWAQTALDIEASRGWPHAPGVVTESFVVTGSSTKWDSSAVVRYAFRVDGETHHGQGVRLDVATNESEDARELVARYPAGREVEVLYDPARPAEAHALEPSELEFWDHLLLGLARFSRWSGALVLSLAALQLWRSERATKRWREAPGNAESPAGSRRG